MFDRIHCHIDVPAFSAADLSLPPPKEDSATVAARVASAREMQTEHYRSLASVRIPMVPATYSNNNPASIPTFIRPFIDINGGC